LFGEVNDATRFEIIAAEPAGGSVLPGPSPCPRSTTAALRRPDQPAPRLQIELLQQLHLISNRGAKEAMRYRYSRRGPEVTRIERRVAFVAVLAQISLDRRRRYLIGRKLVIASKFIRTQYSKCEPAAQMEFVLSALAPKCR